MAPDFERLWFQEFGLPDEQPNYCFYARKLALWAEQLCFTVLQEPCLVSINQSKLQLQDKFFEWYIVVPKKHRVLISANHICLFQVYQLAYERLRVAELAITPPLLFLPPPPAALPPPPPPPPPVQPQIAGIFLGEQLD